MINLNHDPSIDSVIISLEASISEALIQLDRAGTGALVLCSDGRKLRGLLTDGDIRRAILRGVDVELSCETVATLSPFSVASVVSAKDALQLMNRHGIDHLPVVDSEGVLLKLLLRKDLVTEADLGDSTRERLDRIIIPPEMPIADAMQLLDKAGTGALLLCSDGRRLTALLSDGDIRRAIMRKRSMDDSCVQIANRNPITARGYLSAEDVLCLMNQHDINHLPVLDDEGNVVEFHLRRDLVGNENAGFSAVVMAGGFGKRLLPLTQQTPKPMLPIGDRPLLERTIERLRRSGVRDVSLTTHYLPENIRQHFGDGERFGVHLNYSQEEHPLGTAGGLRLMQRPTTPFLVINGDILTDVSFEDMLEYHRLHHARLTVGVRKYEVKVPFGVVECDDVRITELKEKPDLTFFINAGVYLLEPSAYDLIPERQRFDMTDLIKLLLDRGEMVVSFPIIEYWLDVGRHEDYEKAQEDIRSGKLRNEGNGFHQ